MLTISFIIIFFMTGSVGFGAAMIFAGSSQKETKLKHCCISGITIGTIWVLIDILTYNVFKM